MIAPGRNEADLEDIPEPLRKGLEFTFVDDVDEVVEGRPAGRSAPPTRFGEAASRVCSPGGPQAHRREGDMGAKKKVAQAGAAAYAARNNPYVQRVVDDEELRANLWQAYESARGGRGGRLSNGKRPTSTQIFDGRSCRRTFARG